MRTWKQGAVGRISLRDGKEVFVKCLKYPLAVFYGNYSRETKVFEEELFCAFLDLSVLRFIDRIDEIALGKSAGKSVINTVESRLLAIDDIECLLKKIEK
jgi:hypothetical protein